MVSKEDFNKLVGFTTELWDKQKTDLEKIEAQILKVEARLSEFAEKPMVKSSIDEIKEQTDMLYLHNSSLHKDISTTKDSVFKLIEILEKLAIDKGLITPPKPKTPLEKIEEIKEVMVQEETLPVEAPKTPSDVKAHCVRCKAETHIIDVQPGKLNGRDYLMGNCSVCGTRLAKPI